MVARRGRRIGHAKGTGTQRGGSLSVRLEGTGLTSESMTYRLRMDGRIHGNEPGHARVEAGARISD